MAYVNKITFHYQRTINLGDYNNLRLSLMPTIQLDAEDDLDTVSKEVWAMCRASVSHAAAPIVAGYNVGDLHGITEEELFLGLPVETFGLGGTGTATIEKGENEDAN